MKHQLNNREKISFLKYYYTDWQYRKLYQRIKGTKLRSRKYAGTRVLYPADGNQKLKQMIESGESFMAGRFGSIELSVAAEILRSQCLRKKYDMNRLKDLNRNAGFTESREEDYAAFADIMLDAASECDLMGVWYNQMEDWICRHYMKKETILTDRSVYDFWNYEEPFTMALKGKQVLVIHPFEQSIIQQYARREQLFPGRDTLPEFELRTLKAVQTIGNQKDERFSTWFEALDYMYQEAMKKEFDIAIIGCGAYGFPLAAQIKRAGKAAIHMGGVTQMLFGIKGRRWDQEQGVSDIYNESWVYPDEKERPQNFEAVEGGCYW